MSGYKLIDKSPEVIAELNMKEKRILTIAGNKIMNSAKKSIHSGTPESTGIHGYIGGTLKQSINYKVANDSVYIGTNIHYGKYNEFGTRKWPNPRNKNFLKNACQRNIGNLHMEAVKILKG